MRRALSLAVASLLGSAAWGAPTTLIPNGFGTTVSAPISGTYKITGGLPVGTNLFHSFSTFNLGTGATANFTVASNVANIFARVTGGPSTIDGIITSTLTTSSALSNANLWFINPAGVMFTANAQVNLGGAFIVTTADRVEFNDGSMFYGDVNHPTQDAGLTTAPVSAFGFLGTTPQPVSFTGSQFLPAGGTGFHIIGGDVSLNNAQLYPFGGNLSLFSAASSGEVPFNIASPGAGYASANLSQLGTVGMTNNSNFEIDTYGGAQGSVVIRCGKITIDNSSVSTVNYAAQPGDNVSVQANQLTVSGGGNIFNDTSGAGTSGNISLNVAGNIEVDGTGSQVSDRSDGAGNAGTLTVTAESIALNDGDIFSSTNQSGNAGLVDVMSGALSMTGNSRLSSISNGSGNSGTVQLTLSGPLTMSDTSGILADTYVSGQGGNVNITAPQISMTGESMISASTNFGTGPGGNIMVTTDSLSIDGSLPIVFVLGEFPAGYTGITAESLASAPAGSVTVNAGKLALTNGAVISTVSFSGGSGGPISVTCGQGQLSGGSEICSSSLADAGSLEVTSTTSLSLLGNSSIDASAGGNGGGVILHVNNLLYLNDSSIQAFAGLPLPTRPITPPGLRGGNILIDPQFVILNNSLISANDLAPGGQDGNITNTADFFFSSDSILHATGTINTTAPDLDLAQSLAFLPANLVNAENRLRERCDTAANHEFSTFIVVGRGGIENAPEELQPDFGSTQAAPPDVTAK